MIRTTRSNQETYENFALKEPLLPPIEVKSVDLNGNNVIKSPTRRELTNNHQRAELQMNVLSNQNAALIELQQSLPLLSPRTSAAAAAVLAGPIGGQLVLFRESEPEPEEETALMSDGQCSVITNGARRSPPERMSPPAIAARECIARATGGLAGGVGLYTIEERPPTVVNTQLSASSNSTRGAAVESFIGCNGGTDSSAAHSAGSSASSANNTDASNSDSHQLNNLNNSAVHTELYQRVSFQPEQRAPSTPKHRSLPASPDPLERFRLQNSFSGINTN